MVLLAFELLPISTLLAVLTNEILETAIAAHDVLMEKETFKSLSSYFSGIHPVLSQLMSRDMNETPATREALVSLGKDIRAARSLVEMCQKKSRFYQLVNCRSIVKQAQQITRDVGNSLALLSLASADVSIDIRNNVEKLKDEMIHAEYQASQQKLEIVDMIEMGIRQHKTDQAFLNVLIRGIAQAVGVDSVEDCSEIRKELEYFRKEKEDAALRKELEEEAFMEQIIGLLSRADSAMSSESIREDYRSKKRSVNFDVEQEPLDSFRCPLTKEVMEDPVSVATGQTYERAKIEEWFENGNDTDPISKRVLANRNLRPNHKIRDCIEEWIERNHIIRLQNAIKKLKSEEEDKIIEALDDLFGMCNANHRIKYWIAEEGLVALIVQKLKSRDKPLKRKCLLVLNNLIAENNDNKTQFVDAHGVELVVKSCLARTVDISKLALNLLVELLKPDFSGMPSQAPVVLDKLSQEVGAILLLVTICNGEDPEVVDNAKKILLQLSQKDENIIEMARVNWFAPMIERLRDGPDHSRLIMANAIGELAHQSQSLDILGEGVIQALAKMMNGSLEIMTAALRALGTLVSSSSNKRRLANEGAVPLIIKHLFEVRNPSNVRQLAANILENLVLSDGSKYLIDANGVGIDLREIVHHLLGLQRNISSSWSINKHILLILLGLLSSPEAHETRRIFNEADGVSVLLFLFEMVIPEIRIILVQLLYCIASEYAKEISRFISEKDMSAYFVRLIQNSSQDVQIAATGILACLPLEDTDLTNDLLKKNILPALCQLLKNGSPKLKENATGALIRFTLPSDMELQKTIVDLGIYPVLRSILISGTPLAKVRAVNALHHFSESTPNLSIPPQVSGCFCIRRKNPPVCCIHGGLCDEKTTFCLVQANVVPDIVLLLRDRDSDVAAASLNALYSLFSDSENLEKGALFLHQVMAIEPIIDLVLHGAVTTRERAVMLLKKLFQISQIRELYGGRAQIPLVDLATNAEDSIGKQASLVLASIQHDNSSMLF